MTADSSSRPDDANEDDWDLDEEDLNLNPPADPAQKGEKTESRPPIAADASVPPPDKSPGVKSEPMPSPEPTTPPTEPTPARRRSPSTSDRRATSLAEKFSVLAVVLILGGLLYWGIATFYQAAPEGTLVEFTTDFPVEGRAVTVGAVETWWREPVRDGDKVDVGVVIEAELIPCARIVITGGSATDLQVSFRDGDGNLIGDTINLAVENGRFERSESTEVTIHGTDGFRDASSINAYVNQDLNPWFLEIVEGSDQEPLVKARVSAERKENP